MHPLLDPEDDNDPQQRLNILGGLTAARGSYASGWLKIIDYLYAAPLGVPRGAPPITLDAIIAASQAHASDSGGATPGLDPVALEQQMRSLPPEQVETTKQAVDGALEAASGIDEFLGQTLGAAHSISFEELRNALGQLQRTIAANLPGAATESDAAPGTGGGGETAPDAATMSAASGGSSPGVIRNRTDVVRALEKVCDYYRRFEPGSPVPYLLRRAQKLASMSFFEAVQELNIASADTLRPAMGSSLDNEIPPSV